MKEQSFQKNSGQAALISVFFVMMIMLSAVFGISSLALNERASATNSMESRRAYFAAEAGIEDAVYRYNSSPFTITLNGAESTIEIETVSPSRRQITANGDADNRKRATRAEIIIKPGASFSMALQAGTGGIKLGEGSAIYGNVYSNGSIIGDNNASTSGNVSIAGSQITLHQLYDTQNDNYNIGQVDSKIDIAQSFTPTVTGTISQVSLFIKKFNTPGNRDIKIVTSSGGSPTKTVKASGLIGANQVTGNLAWIDIPLDSTPTLSSGTTYWIIFDSSLNSANYYVWGYDNAGTGSKYSPSWNASSPVWSSIAGKMNYKVWFGDAPNIAKDIEVGGNLYAHTIQNSKVHGDAYYQTIDQYSLDWLNTYSISPGVAHAATTDLPLANMPISDAQIDAWEAEAEDGDIYGDDPSEPCPYEPPSGATIGPMRIDCYFHIPNNTSLTIKSPIWVNGDINIANADTFVLDPLASPGE
ncbi:MAG: pilus assembly PilX N-terminal domain-containing protein, partial [Patescibacteria group bacterium]